MKKILLILITIMLLCGCGKSEEQYLSDLGEEREDINQDFDKLQQTIIVGNAAYYIQIQIIYVILILKVKRVFRYVAELTADMIQMIVMHIYLLQLICVHMEIICMQLLTVWIKQEGHYIE